MKRIAGYSNIFYLQKMNEEKSLTVIVPFAFRRLSTLEDLLDHLLEDGWQFEELRFGFVLIFKRCKPKIEKHLILLTTYDRFGTSRPYGKDVLKKYIPSFDRKDPYFDDFLENTFFFSHISGAYYYYFYHFIDLDNTIRDMARHKRKKKDISAQLFSSILFLTYLVSIVYVLLTPNLDNRVGLFTRLIFIAIMFIAVNIFMHRKREK